jgi:iron(II)-dependent oxidoreductase
MVYVPAGQFEMGSDDDGVDYAMQLCNELSDDCQRRWYENQQPVHMVALDGFWIDKYEVTNAQYQKCVEAGECQAPTMCNWGQSTYGKADKADHPAVCVNWQGAQDYCEWAGGRLPTEAEWEYAARGPAENVFPWGDTFDGTLANSCDTNCTQDWKNTDYDDGYEQTAPVGSYPDGTSWCGAEDMAGNAWEWVNDWYDSDYYRVSPAENPGGPSSGEYRVARGGSWRDGSNGVLLLAAFRYYPGVPSIRTSNGGFRCASAIRLLPTEPVTNEVYLEVFEVAWRTVDETYFDPEFGGLDWDAVHNEYGPMVAAAQDEETLYQILNQMLWTLDVSHTGVGPGDMWQSVEPVAFAQAEIGIDVRLLDGQAVITRVEAESPAEEAGLRPGFVIRDIMEIRIGNTFMQCTGRQPGIHTINADGRLATAIGRQ